MDITRAKDINEAIEIAEKFKRAGSHNWFRGQTKNWLVQSSLARLDESAKQGVLEKMGRFEFWVKTTPGLEHLASHVDQIIAVAQHYGVPTHFVDFTTEPRIAGFFASNTQHGNGEPGCIICLNTDDLKNFWEPLTDAYPLPDLLELTVQDLWRLEAQHGRFLFCQYDLIEKIYDFDRIVFPNTKQLSGIISDEIYPRRKSNLEILLDQYFMNESLIEGQRSMDLSNVKTLFVETPEGGCVPEVFPQGLPEHTSWSTATLTFWLNVAAESFLDSRTALECEVFVDNSKDFSFIAHAAQAQILKNLMAISGARSKLISWRIILSDNTTLHRAFSSNMADRLARLWDGLRRLPYSDEDICTGLGMCIAFGIALRGDFGNSSHKHWETAAVACLNQPTELEFGAVDGSYSKGYASQGKLLSAVRSDIASFMSSEWRKEIAGKVVSILHMSHDPRKTFDFHKLAPVFATEIAPFQVLARTGAIFYSPARLNALGLP